MVDCAPCVYIMLHKPAGLLSATEDRDQRTVLDLLPEDLRRRGLFPVGRLDKDTEGLLLLTDDGPSGPRPALPQKTTWTRCTTPRWRVGWTGRTLRPWRRDGAGGRAALSARGAGAAGDGSQCHVTLREGKFHQVKRMLAARGKPVVYLKRPVHGAHWLDEKLAPGEWRPLTGGRRRLLRRG